MLPVASCEGSTPSGVGCLWPEGDFTFFKMGAPRAPDQLITVLRAISLPLDKVFEFFLDSFWMGSIASGLSECKECKRRGCH